MQAGRWIKKQESGFGIMEGEKFPPSYNYRLVGRTQDGVLKVTVETSSFEEKLRIFRKTPVWCEDCFQFKPHLHLERLDQIKPKQLPRSYFVGSIADWNDSKFKRHDLEIIIDKMRECSQHIFVIFSKSPGRFIKFDFPENVWLGTSVQNSNLDLIRIETLISACPDNKKIVSHEPISGPITFSFPEIDWWIIGAETGRRKNKIIPKREWVVDTAVTRGQPVWIKDNIIEYFPDLNMKNLPKDYILDKQQNNRTGRPYSYRNRKE